MRYHPKHGPKIPPHDARRNAGFARHTKACTVRKTRKGDPLSAPHEDPERPAPPGAGYELYRHKAAESLETEGWHGLYWARRTESGDYEIRSVPTSLGEPSAPGGTMPRDGFERLYKRVDS